MKFIILTLAAFCVFSLSGCQQNAENITVEERQKSTEELDAIEFKLIDVKGKTYIVAQDARNTWIFEKKANRCNCDKNNKHSAVGH